MLNNRTTPPRSEDLDNETAIWDRLRAEIDGQSRSSDVYLAARRGHVSESEYLEYDDEELSAAMQAEEQDAQGRSPREHEFSDLEERISEDEVPLDDESLLDVHDPALAAPAAGRRSQPPSRSAYAQSAPVHHEVHEVHDVVDEAQTGERISYFEQAQVEAYQQTPIAAFAAEHAASLAKAQGQSRYEQAWAEWDRQFEPTNNLIHTSPLEPRSAKRSRFLVPGLALAALIGLSAAAYQLVIVPGQQEAVAVASPAAKVTPAAQPVVDDQAERAEAAQKAADDAIARADEAAKAAQGTPAPSEPGRGAGDVQARVGTTQEESSEARRERLREEKRAARREARHRRREERRAADRGGDGETKVSASSSSDDGETETVRPAKKRGSKAGSGEDSDDPLYGLE